MGICLCTRNLSIDKFLLVKIVLLEDSVIVSNVIRFTVHRGMLSVIGSRNSKVV